MLGVIRVIFGNLILTAMSYGLFTPPMPKTAFMVVLQSMTKKVYIGAYNGFLYSFDKMSGELIWANPVGDFIGASPLLANGGLYIAVETAHPNGFVAKLDCNTGETQWVSEWLGGHSHSSPTFDPQNQQILVGANSGRAFAFDHATGQTRWQTQYDGPIKGTILVYGDKSYFASWDRKYHAIDNKTGKKLWAFTVGGRIQTSLTLVPEIGLGVTNTPPWSIGCH